MADFDPNITKPMARPQASPAKDEREGRVKMVNNTEKLSQARIKEAKEMAWMTNHFWLLNTSLTLGMYSYFILACSSFP